MALATVTLTTGVTDLYPRSTGLLIITSTLSATAYATATGGVLIDISAILTQLGGTGTTQMSGANTEVRISTTAVNWADVYGGIAVGVFPTPASTNIGALTKTATSGQFTLRLYVTTTGVEIGDQNVTGTLTLFVFLNCGARSYNA